MMKQVVIGVILLLMVPVCSNAWAGGRDVFIRECGACHKINGKAQPVNPGDKAAIVWKKYFKRHRHPVDISNISSEDMKIILKYLCNHAADSEQPESAVIPK